MGIDKKSLEMPAAEFTIADVDDAPKLPELFDQIAPDEEIVIASAVALSTLASATAPLPPAVQPRLSSPAKSPSPVNPTPPGCRT
ncbi:hypothetical protein MASR2M74_08970 [Paracoccaceae bacterium]